MIRVGLLGAAGIAPQAVIIPSRRRDDLAVVAVAARSLESARRYAATHGIERVYGTYEALLGQPDIDLVYVALPPSEHARWTIAAVQAGKHVLCEKPITMNADEAATVAAAADRAGRHVIEAFHDHYHRWRSSPICGGPVGSGRSPRSRRASLPTTQSVQPRSGMSPNLAEGR
jgi:predicted dehydrogenase